MIRTIVMFLFVVLSFSISGQEQGYPRVISFDTLEERLDQHNDTTYVFHFWATWCIPCLEEMAHFQKLEKDSFAFPIRILLVSLDFIHQIQSKLMPYMNRHGINSEVVVLTYINPNDWIDKVDPSWSGALPATLVRHLGESYFREGVFENHHDLQQFVLGSR